MTASPGDALQKAAADQAALNALPEHERQAELQRRAELFRKKNSLSGRVMAKVKFWLVVAALLVGAFFALRLIAGLIYGDTTAIEHVTTGDCINFPAADEETDRIATPDCSELHEGQVFHDFRPRGMDAGQRRAECLANLSNVDLRTLGFGDDYGAEVGNFSAAFENGRISETFCWVKFPEPVTGSVVVDN